MVGDLDGELYRPFVMNTTIKGYWVKPPSNHRQTTVKEHFRQAKAMLTIFNLNDFIYFISDYI